MSERDLKELLREKVLSPGLALVLAEEYAREAGRQLAKEIPRPREAVTRTVDKRDYPVQRTFSIIDASVPGKLNEMTIVSPSELFSILILSDGVQKLSRSYSELLQLSPHSSFIDAFEDAANGVYILHVKEMYWLSDFAVMLYVDSPTAITFKNIWVVWEEKIFSNSPR